MSSSAIWIVLAHVKKKKKKKKLAIKSQDLWELQVMHDPITLHFQC